MKRTFPIVRILLVLACMLLVVVPRSSAAAMRQGLSPRSSAAAMRQRLSSDEANNEALVLRLLYEGVDQRNLAVLNDVLAPTFVSHSPFGTSTGIPGFEKVAGALLTAFPDLHITVVEVDAIGDTVVVRDTTTATDKGVFLGIRPTGKKVGWTELQFWHLSQGKIVEQWVSFDTLGVLKQIKGS
jgi:predicted ester cyclase